MGGEMRGGILLEPDWSWGLVRDGKQLREGKVELKDFGAGFSVLTVQYCNALDF